MGDLINRREAIDELRQLAEIMNEWSNRYAEQRRGVLTAVNIVEDLPSAQPEIIRCKDCKHYIDHCCYERNHIKVGLFLHENNFCSWAKR